MSLGRISSVSCLNSVSSKRSMLMSLRVPSLSRSMSRLSLLMLMLRSGLLLSFLSSSSLLFSLGSLSLLDLSGSRLLDSSSRGLSLSSSGRRLLLSGSRSSARRARGTGLGSKTARLSDSAYTAAVVLPDVVRVGARHAAAVALVPLIAVAVVTVIASEGDQETWFCQENGLGVIVRVTYRSLRGRRTEGYQAADA